MQTLLALCRIRGMGKASSIILILIMLLLPSCATESGTGSYSDSEKEAALLLLGSDMISMVESEGEIGAEAFLAALPASFRAYEGYSPLYGALSSSYAEAVSSIVSPILYDVYPLLRSVMDVAATEERDRSIQEPEGLTDMLQMLTARDIYSHLVDRISAMQDELDAAFEEPLRIFLSVRDAYLNLASVGLEAALPVPAPLSAELAAFVAEDVLFTRLGEKETELKSRIPDSPDSPYSVFWEETI